MKKLAAITFILLIFNTSMACAVTGKAFLSHCSSALPNSDDYLRCSSYVIGVLDNMRANKAGDVGFKNICIPDKTNDNEVMSMTLDWLQTNQQSWDMWAAFAVTMAMSENYKCGCDSQ